MAERYNFEEIESKWQSIWAENRVFAVSEEAGKPKYYMLEMLPYPSGELHLGHVRNYSLGDSIARYKRLNAYNVLHPIGWDAFGLPAENAAIENQIPPEDWTLKNIGRMKRQCQRMGFSYDWEREIASCLPDYYRWNQWFFLQMYKRGLAYKRKGHVNWCERCQTVLANEQVVNGCCWRHEETVVVLKDLEQWYLRITDYAEELLQDLEELSGWPENVVTMQRNWIGKSIGARVHFGLEGRLDSTIEVFTTRIDTIFGATFMVLAPEHEMVRAWFDDPEYGPRLASFAEEMRRQDRNLRTDDAVEKVGVFTGRHAVNPFNGEHVPIWVANFVLMEYGTGAIMAVPAHDHRDFEFAKKYKLPIREVIRPADGDGGGLEDGAFTEYGVLVNSGPFSSLPSEDAMIRMAEFAKEKGFGERTISYRLKDWGISRQRYWGTPIPVVYCDRCGSVPVPEEELPVLLPKMEGIQLGGSPLKGISEFVNTNCPQCQGPARRETDTMDTFVDSSWYFYRYIDPRNTRGPFGVQSARYWFPVDTYIGGVEHAVLHLIYMRFFSKMMRDLGLVEFDEPVTRLFTQGMVLKDGAKMSKSRGNTVSPDRIVKDYGADALRLFIQFCAPPDGELDWSDKGLEGCSRFLNRFWRLARRYAVGGTAAAPSQGVLSSRARALRRKTHQTIRKVTEDVERVHQNTAIAAIMELLNSVYEYVDREEPDRDLLHEVLSQMTLLLSPFSPHIAEEVWEWLGNSTMITSARWPEFDPELAKEEEIEIVVQVNGKVRSKFNVPADISEEALQQKALEDRRISAYVGDKAVQRIVVVPKKLVNVVIS
jgi:leucyl-tRNA synthetase